MGERMQKGEERKLKDTGDKRWEKGFIGRREKS
jgi:hypothetical protein